MKLTKVEAGEYRSPDGLWTIAREDYPSMEEWDGTPRDVTWYAIPTKVWASGGALPDAAYEAGTRRAVVAWLDQQAQRGGL